MVREVWVEERRNSGTKRVEENLREENERRGELEQEGSEDLEQERKVRNICHFQAGKGLLFFLSPHWAGQRPTTARILWVTLFIYYCLL